MSSVIRAPALRRILASPRDSPSICSGSMRESMQVTTARPRGRAARQPLVLVLRGVALVGGQDVVEGTHLLTLTQTAAWGA